MTTKKSAQTTQSLISRWINRQPLSIKVACVEVLGTNRKTDIMRVLRTQHLLGYTATGSRHEILPAGEFYFTHDAARRAQGKQLVLSANLGGDWADKAGSEVYITPINTFRLKKDIFDQRLMEMIDPNSLATRNGKAISQMLKGIDLASLEPSDEVADDAWSNEGPIDELMEIVRQCIKNGDQIPAPVRAGIYLTRPRTLALINETAERAGVDLGDREEAIAHVGRWCSFPMREMLDQVFLNEQAWDKYIEQVAEMTAEAWLGYSPELV